MNSVDKQVATQLRVIEALGWTDIETHKHNMLGTVTFWGRHKDVSDSLLVNLPRVQIPDYTEDELAIRRAVAKFDEDKYMQWIEEIQQLCVMALGYSGIDLAYNPPVRILATAFERVLLS